MYIAAPQHLYMPDRRYPSPTSARPPTLSTACPITHPPLSHHCLRATQIDWTTQGLDMSVIDKPNDIDIMHFFDTVYRANSTAGVHFNATKVARMRVVDCM